MAFGPHEAPSIDLLLVGGGLANGLIAFRLSQQRPELRIKVIEGADRLGGVHTWSFFETDVARSQLQWLSPLIAHRWPGYCVMFPNGERRLGTGYCSLTAERFDQVVRTTLGDRVMLGTPVTEVHADGVVLTDGRRISAAAVIDGRGPATAPHLELGFQKFVGLEVRLEAPHGLAEPIVMDATVDQRGGYRFVYVLPFEDTSLLIEDTRYTDGDALDRAEFEGGVRQYADRQGWRIAEVLRREEGVLPVALDGDFYAHFSALGPSAQSGLRAGLFHPTTGYSLPDAVRLADLLSSTTWRDGSDLAATIQAHATQVWNSRGFYRLLDRMLFKAARPEQRYRILERFYRLPQPLIERFYGGRSTFADKARILVGKPPVPVGAALPCLLEKGHAR